MGSNGQINFNNQVYELVRKIPKGKASTYGEIAKVIQKYESVFSTSRKAKIKMQKYKTKFKINNRFLPRLVGFVLHQNQDPNVPCHRIVDRNGRLAPNFGGPSLKSYGRLVPAKFQRSGVFDGAEEQKRRLLAEGVKFIDEIHVDLGSCLWKA
ncbi:MGMT family protein [Candidatus Curtissbacteria bacterium]|nr:MGMT family protein [Candidatus Curtissbacteria bacterium]